MKTREAPRGVWLTIHQNAHCAPKGFGPTSKACPRDPVMRSSLGMMRWLACCAVAMPTPLRMFEDDSNPLNPTKWAGEFNAYSAVNTWDGNLYTPKIIRDLKLNYYTTMHGSGELGGIAATENALSVMIGFVALENRGNAVDAAVAAACASIVLSLGGDISFAGTTSFVIHDATSQRTYNLLGEFGGVPAQDPSELNGPSLPTTAGKFVLVPGVLAAFEKAVALFGSGRYTLSDLLLPATFLAREGFLLVDRWCTLANMSTVLGNSPGGRSLQSDVRAHCFERCRDRSLPQGSICPYADRETNMTQPKLAEFLASVREHGVSAAMYSNESQWPTETVRVVRSAGGQLNAEDLSAYADRTNTVVRSSCEASWQPRDAGVRCLRATLGSFDGSTQVAGPDLESGGARLVEAVNQLRLSSTTGLLGDYRTNASVLARLQQLACYQQLEDATHFNQSYRATQKHAVELAERLSQARQDNMASELCEGMPPSSHSNALVSADSQGNVVSMYHTINSDPWGSGLVISGVALPDAGRQSYNKRYLKAVWDQGGQHLPPPSASIPNVLQPFVLLSNGLPFAAASTIGLGSNVRPLQLMTLLLQGVTPTEAVRAPEYELNPPSNVGGHRLVRRCQDSSNECDNTNRTAHPSRRGCEHTHTKCPVIDLV